MMCVSTTALTEVLWKLAIQRLEETNRLTGLSVRTDLEPNRPRLIKQPARNYRKSFQRRISLDKFKTHFRFVRIRCSLFASEAILISAASQAKAFTKEVLLFIA